MPRSLAHFFDMAASNRGNRSSHTRCIAALAGFLIFSQVPAPAMAGIGGLWASLCFSSPSLYIGYGPSIGSAIIGAIGAFVDGCHGLDLRSRGGEIADEGSNSR